jgi:hypothetical protein
MRGCGRFGLVGVYSAAAATKGDRNERSRELWGISCQAAGAFSSSLSTSMALSSCPECSVPRREEKKRKQCLVCKTPRTFRPSRRKVSKALDGIDIDDNRKEIVHVVLI